MLRHRRHLGGVDALRGRAHVTDPTNAAVTGLLTPDGSDWDDAMLDALRIPRAVLPAIVDSSGALGAASALPGRPLICGMVGDQQASLLGQGCARPGLGQGHLRHRRHARPVRGRRCVPASRARRGRAASRSSPGSARGTLTWGVEAIMLSAGTCVDWLRDDLGLLASAAESHDVAAALRDTGGVWFVPALLGLGTP